MSLKQKKTKLNYSDYAKYSSIAFQMLVTIVLFAFGGFKLDEWLNIKFPVFTIILSLAGVGVSIYYAIKDFLKITNKDGQAKSKNDNK